MYKFRLNVVYDDASEVLSALRAHLCGEGSPLMVFYANRQSSEIMEFDIMSDESCCVSLESIKEALPFVKDWNIRISLSYF